MASSDAVVKIARTTICGSDPHILKGDAPTVTHGRILGHEAVGGVDEVGAVVSSFQAHSQREDKGMHIWAESHLQRQDEAIGDLQLVSCLWDATTSHRQGALRTRAHSLRQRTRVFLGTRENCGPALSLLLRSSG